MFICRLNIYNLIKIFIIALTSAKLIYTYILHYYSINLILGQEHKLAITPTKFYASVNNVAIQHGLDAQVCSFVDIKEQLSEH